MRTSAVILLFSLLSAIILAQDTKDDIRIELRNEGAQIDTLLGESDGFLTGAEPTIAVNPLNPDNVVVSFLGQKEITDLKGTTAPIFVSFDGGDSWSEANFPKDSIFLNDFPEYADFFGEGDPVLAFDKDGKLYYVWLSIGFDVLDANKYLVATYWAWSDDGGLSFEVDQDLEVRNFCNGLGNQREGLFLDRPWLAVDKSEGANEGTVYVQGRLVGVDTTHSIFGEVNDNSVILFKDPQERAFQLMPILPDSLTQADITQYPNLIVDNQGQLRSSFVAYKSQSATKISDAYHLVTKDKGATHTLSGPIATVKNRIGTTVHHRENPMPDAVVHPSTSTIHYVITDEQDSTLVSYYVQSKDEGVSWSEPKTIQQLTNTEFLQTMQPTIAIDEETGLISIGFFGLDEKSEGNFHLTVSRDDGETWEEPCVLSSEISNFDRNPFLFWGDYWDSKVVGNQTYIVWTDGRDTIGPKVYFARVDHTESTATVSYTAVTDQLVVHPIFPSPASSEINLNILARKEQVLRISLLDSKGAIVSRLADENIRSGTNHIRRDLQAGLSSGIYFILIESAFGNFTKKFYLAN